MSLNRRQFIKYASGSLALGAMGTAGCDVLVPQGARLQASTLSTPLPLRTPILVMIELNGGNDILNTHVPYAVPGVTGAYLSARPSLAMRTVTTVRPYAAPPSGNYLPPVLDLDGRYGFHGNLVWLANRWHQRGDVAVVQGVGENVAQERSHFAAMAYRWAAAFTGPLLNTGWLGRYNDARNQNQPVASVSVAGMNQSLVGAQTPALVVGDVSSFNWSITSAVPSRTTFLADLNGMGAALPASMNKAATAAAAIARTGAAIGAVQGAGQPALNSGVSAGSLAYQLSQVAMMILGGLPCQTYVATMGGFDTHGGEPYNHFAQLGAVDLALQRFFGYIDASSRAQDVFVLISSEFGRQVTQNAGTGTDHGRASSAILIGGGVRGGLYGQMPSLTVRDFDAMIPTVDFRSVFATILNRLGGDSALTAAVLGQDESGHDFADLGVFTGPAPVADLAGGAADGGTADGGSAADSGRDGAGAAVDAGAMDSAPSIPPDASTGPTADMRTRI